MESRKLIAILVMVLVLASMTSGAQFLKVNDEDVNSITIKVGQSCTVEVYSNNYVGYLDNIGFDDCNGLGDFYPVETTPEAGSNAEVNPVNQSDFCGYQIITYYPWTGVHFRFQYDALQIGETTLKLYGHPLQSKIEVDSLQITVISPEVGTAFTYQGRLIDGNEPADGFYDFQFRLFDSPDIILANQLGSAIVVNEMDVIDGYFTVELDFGMDVFAGEARWLEIAVRPGNSSDPDDFVTLSPRQEVTPTPYAIYAKTAENVVEEIVPQGVIVMWSGSIGSIPSGWALCNGSNGTPDLRDRFIVAAGGSYGVGNTGGSTQHNHGGQTGNHTLTIAEIPAHKHTYWYYNVCDRRIGDLDKRNSPENLVPGETSSEGGDQPHSHGISNANHLPPYYALAYIMKL